jgi:hypothetical protein
VFRVSGLEGQTFHLSEETFGRAAITEGTFKLPAIWPLEHALAVEVIIAECAMIASSIAPIHYAET